MSKKAEKIFDDLLIEYADENLQVKIDKDLLLNLKIHRTALTRYVNQWIEQKKVKWIGTSTLQLMVNENKKEMEGELEEDIPASQEAKVKKGENKENASSNLKSQGVLQLRENLINIIIEMIEKKFDTKLTKEMFVYISENVSGYEVWEKTVRNIMNANLPDNLIKGYLDYVIKEQI
jgi:hypothetical protein